MSRVRASPASRAAGQTQKLSVSLVQKIQLTMVCGRECTSLLLGGQAPLTSDFAPRGQMAHLVSYKEFYNDAINELVDFTEDFARWKDTQRCSFSFCSHRMYSRHRTLHRHP